MGNLLSSTAAAVRRSNTDDSDGYGGGGGGNGGGMGGGGGGGGANGNSYRYPPKNNRPYFASHFIMGGEKFDCPQPESFLFGENSDLNYLGSRPVSFPYPPPAANEPTKTLKSLINIRRDSLHLSLIHEEDAQGAGSTAAAAAEEGAPKPPPKDRRYNVTFTFDSDVRCAVTIYYFCTEEITQNGVSYTSIRKDMTSDTYEYRRGAAHVFNHPEHVFQPSLCEKEIQASSTADESNANQPDLIALAVHCVSLEGDAPRQSHTTIGAFTRYSDSSYSLKAHKQKLFVDGLSYLLQEIYGLENKTTDKPYSDVDDDIDDCGAECVVCMVDLRDTIILPCRHLCLCYACADSLRYQANNCPICRAPFRALLQIRAVQKIGQVTHPALQPAVDPDPTSDLPVPPGYQCVSLIEALNGPSQNKAAAPPPAVFPPPGHSEKKSRRKSSKSKSASTSSAAAGPSGAGTSSSISGPGPVVPEETETMIEETGSGPLQQHQRSRSGSSRNVSVKYINERGGSSDLAGGNVSATSVRSVSSSASSVREKPTTVAATGDGESDNLVSSMDLIDEELAKMSGGCRTPPPTAASAAPSAATTVVLTPPPTMATAVGREGDEDEAVVVNLASGSTTRVSLPGTPTSVVSARSSQDSSSSSSSTKQLLPQQQPQSVIQAPAASTSSFVAPRSTGSAVIVRVHPRTTSEPTVDEEVNAENEEDC